MKPADHHAMMMAAPPSFEGFEAVRQFVEDDRAKLQAKVDAMLATVQITEIRSPLSYHVHYEARARHGNRLLAVNRVVSFEQIESGGPGFIDHVFGSMRHMLAKAVRDEG